MLIEVFSDVICPWCYIGKKRLDAVLDGPLGEGVELVWRPFLLHASLPSDGLDRAEFLRMRYGDDADPARVPERIAAEAESVGIALDFGRIKRLPNTRNAHRLIAFAEGHGRQHELAEILFRYYFCEGEDVGDTDVLVRAAGEAGLDADAVAGYLASGRGVSALDADLERGRELGVVGVPNYLLAGRFALPGAQSDDVIAHFIERTKTVLAAEKVLARQDPGGRTKRGGVVCVNTCLARIS